LNNLHAPKPIFKVCHVIVSHISGGTLGAYNVCAIAAASSATITIRNITGSTLTEAPVIKFTVIKSVTA
jgi:hypothetical protein